jgi:hypothetical protein
MAENRIRGRELLGGDPQRLELSDGSRLMLDSSVDQDRVQWRRLGRRRSSVSVSEAVDLAGSEFGDYVAIRTRAEAAWLRAVADWYRDQADRLQRELAETGAPA